MSSPPRRTPDDAERRRFLARTVQAAGGVSLLGDLLLDPARAALDRRLVGRAHREAPRIVPAALGAWAGVVGAADLARSQSSEPSSGHPGEEGP